MTDNRTTELMPCPFCGGKATLRMCWMEDGHRYRVVECVECGATTPGNYSEVGDQSAWDWNTRTPEQAIAATLGSGTCELKHASWDDGQCTWGCICSACDARFEHETGIGYNYCPNCGAKIVQGVDNAD